MSGRLLVQLLTLFVCFFFQIFAKESAYGQSNGKQALFKVFWSILVSNRLKNTKANELYRCNQDSRAFQIQ